MERCSSVMDEKQRDAAPHNSLGAAAAIAQKKEKPAGFGVRYIFQKFAQGSSAAVGSPWAFFLAALVIIAWAVTGPIFHYSDTWQLVINTGTTIVTFLMVFLIQNTQNRDGLAMHLKLDELIRAIENADDKLIRAEDETDEELVALKAQYEALCDQHETLQAQLHAGVRRRA
jgi:low affinity Fe/Cu permease